MLGSAHVRAPSRSVVLGALIAAASLSSAPERAVARGAACPAGMAAVAAQFCIDRWEASLDVTDARGRGVRRHSPYHTPEPGVPVVARSRGGVVPQAYVSQEQAAAACERAGKRLCTDREWLAACRGERSRRYPYGDERIPRRCNDSGVSPLRTLHGKDDSVFGFGPMNDPRLNQVPGSLARTGQFKGCRTPGGVHDLVGNLHEWTAAAGGTFRGGYYLDTSINGDGCDYVTTAHVRSYHDYSIGFRCCADLGAQVERAREVRKSGGAGAGERPPALASARRVEVVPGDTLSGIARAHGTTVKELCRANQISAAAPIRPGQQLVVPSRAH